MKRTFQEISLTEEKPNYSECGESSRQRKIDEPEEPEDEGGMNKFPLDDEKIQRKHDPGHSDDDEHQCRFIDVLFDSDVESSLLKESSLQKEVYELEKKQSDDLKEPEDEARSNKVLLLEDNPGQSDDDEWVTCMSIEGAPLEWWDCNPSRFWLNLEQLKKKWNERHRKRMSRYFGINYMGDCGDEEAAEAAFSRILKKKNTPEWSEMFD